jgi:hypothetical protein
MAVAGFVIFLTLTKNKNQNSPQKIQKDFQKF